VQQPQRNEPLPKRRTDIHFPPYRLDLAAGFLRSGDRAISLRPKTWAVLCYLAERPGVLVTKDELLSAVWGDTAVTEATLTKSIGEIRDALHDEVRRPRFVETVHRRGFRFVSAIDGGGPAATPVDTFAPQPPAHVVAREDELRHLHQLLALADGGARQTVFVTGEAGIGKTTLIEAFLAAVGARRESPALIAIGQCVRRHSGEEPLMPVLEAIGRLAQGSHAKRVIELLREHAPAWLVQLPWLIEPTGLQELRGTLSGTTAERMLRVFAHLVDELTQDVTLVLALEDLHWADPSTVDLVSVLAQRPERARLFLLGSYRPAEAIVNAGPFDGVRRLLALRHRSVDVPLGLLPLSGVEAYLAARFGGRTAPPPLARVLHRHTEGNPLFLTTAVDYLVGRGWLEPGDDGSILHADVETLEGHIPGSLRALVEAQLLDLDELEVAVLEAGSVAGLEFGAQTVAAAREVPVEQVEDACESLVRAQRFLAASGTEAWPDGAVAARYAFTHALYQRLLYHRIPAGRRRLLHQRIGERLEAGFGARAAEVAAELAAHFERGTNPACAVTWLERAATSAEQRFAPRESAGYLQRGLTLLSGTSDGPDRATTEIRLATALGTALIATNGFAAAEAWSVLTRARDLALHAEQPLALFRVVYMLVNASLARADVERAPLLADELVQTAARLDGEEARLVADMLAGNAALWEGRFADAARFGGLTSADPTVLGRFVPGENPVVWAHGAEGWRLWLIGRPDAAAASARAAVACARAQPNPINLAMALFLAAHVHLWRGDLDETVAHVDEGRALAREHGFGLWLAGLAGIGGELHLARNDPTAAVGDLQRSLDDFRRIGVIVYVPAILRALADAMLRLGRLPEALAAADEGLTLVRTTLSRWHAPELWRVRGEILAASGHSADAIEACFAHGIETARAQRGRALELRTTAALARHLAGRGRAAEARVRLATVHGAFSEGRDTADMRTGAALLRQIRA
jgi:DNA-binding winged helix-turn-helix (wHTH) protein/tetratricopeptide (TPR) repeat protein